MMIHDYKPIVKSKYPDATLYTKNRYCYVMSKSFPGHTIGSGETANTAWQMAYEVIQEEEK